MGARSENLARAGWLLVGNFREALYGDANGACSVVDAEAEVLARHTERL